ncbi:hypothetical protein C8R44DRAFT_731226 [Mycena epipterygia]|nr:hypothetical protein C8R44DRAFT_731226 [Mycena epipterygia]
MEPFSALLLAPRTHSDALHLGVLNACAASIIHTQTVYGRSQLGPVGTQATFIHLSCWALHTVTSPHIPLPAPEVRPTDPIFAQAHASCHPLISGDGRRYRANFTGAHVHISLDYLTGRNLLALVDFATVTLIHRIASLFPRLGFLELGYAGYSDGAQSYLDSAQISAMHDPALSYVMFDLPRIMTHYGTIEKSPTSWTAVSAVLLGTLHG